MDPTERIIVALDVNNPAEAERIIEQTAPYVAWYKIGLELILAGRHLEVANLVRRYDKQVFLDAKLNDIPNTVGKAGLAASAYADYINVHALSGQKAMEALVTAAAPSKVLAVTILTSLTGHELSEFGFNSSEHYRTYSDITETAVLNLAKIAAAAGVHGLICSAQELISLRRSGLAERFLKVIPGIRPEWAEVDDQKRIMTPTMALREGADMLVIGRPITNPPGDLNPALAAQRILNEIAAA